MAVHHVDDEDRRMLEVGLGVCVVEVRHILVHECDEGCFLVDEDDHRSIHARRRCGAESEGDLATVVDVVCTAGEDALGRSDDLDVVTESECLASIGTGCHHGIAADVTAVGDRSVVDDPTAVGHGTGYIHIRSISDRQCGTCRDCQTGLEDDLV